MQSASSRSAVSAAASANYASDAAYQFLQVACSWWLFTAIVIEIRLGLEYSRKSFQLHDSSSVLQLIDHGFIIDPGIAMFELCPVTSFIAGAQIWAHHHTCLAAEMCLVNNIFDVCNNDLVWYVTIHGKMNVLECKTSIL